MKGRVHKGAKQSKTAEKGGLPGLHHHSWPDGGPRGQACVHACRRRIPAVRCLQASKVDGQLEPNDQHHHQHQRHLGNPGTSGGEPSWRSACGLRISHHNSATSHVPASAHNNKQQNERQAPCVLRRPAEPPSPGTAAARPCTPRSGASPASGGAALPPTGWTSPQHLRPNRPAACLGGRGGGMHPSDGSRHIRGED